MGFLRDQFGQLILDQNGQPLVDELVDGIHVYPDAQPRTSRATTTLEAGLFQYLTDPLPYAGHAEKPFRRTRVLDGCSLANRNDARRELQSRIGQRVYMDRRPSDINDYACVVIKWVNGTHSYGLGGEADGTEAYLTVTVYANGVDAARRGGTIYGLLQLCLSGYTQGYWGDVLVGECTLDTGRSLAYTPSDASDAWTFTRQMDLLVYYYAASTPEYSEWPLAALPTIVVEPTQLRLSLGDSLIAENTPLINAAWLVQASPGSPVITSFGGAPNAAVDIPGVTGTNAEPVISRVTYATIPASPYVTLILTDSSGDSSSKGVQYDG
jgi:hypothetical protein